MTARELNEAWYERRIREIQEAKVGRMNAALIVSIAAFERDRDAFVAAVHEGLDATERAILEAQNPGSLPGEEPA